MGFDFTYSTDGELTTCRFLTSFGEGVIDQHWPGLYEPWDMERDRNPFFQYAVNNNNQEEMAVYLGFAWAMTEMPIRLAVLHYQWYTLRMWWKRDPDAWAKWEFLVDTEDGDLVRREEGFRRARSSGPPVGESSEGHRHDPSGAGIYDLDAAEQLRDLALAALSDASGQVTVFGLADRGERDRIVSAMSGRRRPDLARLLGSDGRMVHLAFGLDLGYYDSIFVAGQGVEQAVAETAGRFDRAALEYQEAIPNLTGPDDLLVALERLRRGGT